MEVILATPQTGPFLLALGTAVVWVPHLATKALVDVITSVVTLSVVILHACLMLEAHKQSIPNDSPLAFLIFKTYYHLTNSGESLCLKVCGSV